MHARPSNYSGEQDSHKFLPRWCQWLKKKKKSACQRRRYKRCRLNPRVGEIPWSRKWQPTPVFLPMKSHGQRNLAGYSPWGHTESDLTCTHAVLGGMESDWGGGE